MDPILATWLAAHHGVVSRRWLIAGGYSPGQIRGMLQAGLLVSVQQGVYVAACSPRSLQQRLVALSLKYHAVASHLTAGQEWGFRRLGRPTAPHVTVPHGQRTTAAGVTVHMCRSLSPADVIRRHDGVVLTSPARTVFDLASLLPAASLESIIEQGLCDQRFTIETLTSVGHRLGTSGRAGSKLFADVLGSRPAGQRPVGSHLELRFIRAWDAAGLPSLERQRPIRLPTGVVLHPDFAEPRRRLLIEVDHATFHGGHQQNMNDRWRDRQYHLLGWRSERVTNDDITHRLPQTIAELALIYNALPSGPP